MPRETFREHPERINRKGRPKLGQSIAERARAFMREMAEAEDPITKKKFRVERIDAFLTSVYAESIRGNMAAAKLLWNYCDGLPPFTGRIITNPPEDEGALTEEQEEAVDEHLREIIMGKDGK